jgi:hypothetical protein
MFVPKSATRFPGEGSSRPFAASTGGGLVPPAAVVFALADDLPDPGMAGFAAGPSEGKCWGEGENATLRSLPSPISSHQRRQSGRQFPPFIQHTARQRAYDEVAPSRVLVQHEGPRGIRPIVTGPARL